MINISVKKENDIITKILLNGHSGMDVFGKDIVCAGVSTALNVTVNAILEFDKNAIVYCNKNPFSLTNIKKDEITNKLLNNLCNTLEELEDSYKDNIKITIN